jgi:hypothetical protein
LQWHSSSGNLFSVADEENFADLCSKKLAKISLTTL